MRILTLTDDASLSVTLSQLPFGHDVVAIDSVDQLEEHDRFFHVALIDLGTTRRGLVGASDVIRSGVSAPCLVLGDEKPIELAVELAPDASVLVRPFSLEELDASLEELAAAARDRERADLETELAAEPASAWEPGPPDVAVSSGPTATVAASVSSEPVPPHVGPPHVEFTVLRAEPLDPQEQTRIAWAENLLAEAAHLERFLDHVPEVVDRRAVAERLLERVEHDMRPLMSVVWVPDDEGRYEALAERRLDSDERVAFDQSMFLSFETNLDAALVSRVDPSQHPLAGIPGIRGETLLAAALRVDDALQGVVMAAGTAYTEADRDRLQSLAVESAPALALAQVVERLRARRLPGVPGP